MFDGYGIYGQFSENGEVPTDLDECGGHTHDIDGVAVYHYHFPYPSQFPWVIGYFKGCPEVSNNEREFGRVSQYGCTSNTTSNGTGNTNTGNGNGVAGNSLEHLNIFIVLLICVYALL